MALLIVAFSWIATSSPAHACRCAKIHAQSLIKKHDYIARVVLLETRQIGKWRSRLNAQSTLSVLKVAKSSPAFANSKTVKVKYEGRFSGTRRTSCSTELPFQTEFWLLAKEKDGELSTHECSIAPIRGQFGDPKIMELLKAMAK